MFVYNPALLLQGTVGDIILSIAVSLLGIALLSWGLAGFFLRKENIWQRLLFLAGGISFVTMDMKLVAAGLVLGILAAGWQARTVFRERAERRLSSA
jgi:TRAP-type uncharacterized transport system fused permease subunit